MMGHEKDYMYYISQNLKYLIDFENSNQKQFAKKWDKPDSTISNYISQNAVIKLDFLTDLQQYYQFSIDDFLSKDFYQLAHPIKYAENSIYSASRYCGLYSLYYFDTADHDSSFNDKDKLKYGLLYIYEQKNLLHAPSYKVNAVFGLSFEQLKKTWYELSDSHLDSQLFLSYNFGKYSYLYHGQIDVFKNIVNISLLCGDKDAVIFSFKNPEGIHHYIGGIGIICSISRGEEKDPCTQFIASCRGLVTSSASEIAQYLKFTSYEIRLSHECDKLLRRIDDYFNPYAKNDFDLNREEKEFLVRFNLEHMVKDIIENHAFKYEKASHKKDYNWYQFIKKFI